MGAKPNFDFVQYNKRCYNLRNALRNPYLAVRELCNRSFYYFLEYFWPVISSDNFKPNWHIKYLCDELQVIAERVAQGLPREHDLVINIPPGLTKTITCSIMFPAWCWTKWHWMRFIMASYSGVLSMESADYSRDLIRSSDFQLVYPEIRIKKDKDNKSNFRIIKIEQDDQVQLGGNRFSTSVGGSLTGFHGHFLIIDDPLNPSQAVSETELNNALHWFDQTLPTRKTDKEVTPTILIMQRLHQADPSGHILEKKKDKVKHICLPGEILTPGYVEKVKPAELVENYTDGLLDPTRMNNAILSELEIDLGQYGYASQIGQNPTPPAGGMFKVDHFQIVLDPPSPVNFVQTVRYWDKAGSKDAGAYTVGVKMSRLASGKFIITDVKRGRWAAEDRERIIRETAEADGGNVIVWHEQEPGSGGKESAEATIRNLAGFVSRADRPTGDKIYRADPYSVQVNNGNVLLLRGDWTHDFVEEHRYFPFSKYKDQVDASSGAMSKLAVKRVAGPVLGRR